MAKRKTDNIVQNEADSQVTAPVETNEVNETVEANETNESEVKDVPVSESKEQAPSQSSANVSVTDIPQYVDKILTRYPNYAELYIDLKGGVYVRGTQQNLVKDAILYKNPYYKQ